MSSYSWVSLWNSPTLDGIEPDILLFLNTLQEKGHYDYKKVWEIQNKQINSNVTKRWSHSQES